MPCEYSSDPVEVALGRGTQDCWWGRRIDGGLLAGGQGLGVKLAKLDSVRWIEMLVPGVLAVPVPGMIYATRSHVMN